MVFLEKQAMAFFIFTTLLTALAGCSGPQENNPGTDTSIAANSPDDESFNDSGLEELANDTGFEQDLGTQDIYPDDFELDNSFEEDLAEIENMSQELENDLSDIENMALEMNETEQQADELETPDPQDFE